MSAENELIEKLLDNMESAIKGRKKNGQEATVKEVITLVSLCNLVMDVNNSKCTGKKRKYTKRIKQEGDDKKDQEEPTLKKD